MIFEEDDEADELFVVRSGRVAVGRRSIDGRESLVALMEAGDLFGEMPLFDEGTRSASARALEHSEMLGIPYGVVREALDANPELLWEVVRLLAERLRNTDSALADAVFLDVTGPHGQAAAGAGRRRRTSSSCRSPRRSWPDWSEHRGSGSTSRSPRSSGSVGSSSSTVATASWLGIAWPSGPVARLSPAEARRAAPAGASRQSQRSAAVQL